MKQTKRWAVIKDKLNLVMTRLLARMIGIIISLGLTFFSTLDPPHGTAPNGYSCAKSMVLKFTVLITFLKNIEIDLRERAMFTYKLIIDIGSLEGKSNYQNIQSLLQIH